MSAAQHIRFACPQCSKQLRAPVQAAGRNAKCRSCGAAVSIPASPTNGRMADDLLLLSDVTRGSISATDLHAIKKSHLETQSSWLATHPYNKSRIDRAVKANAAGVFQLDRPARELVQHYKSLCKNVTWDFYRDQLWSGAGRTSNPLAMQYLLSCSDLLP